MAQRGINKVILIGNLGNDPDVRYMPNGNAVTNISIATSDAWRDKQTGELQERTEWHRVVFYNRLAEIAGEFLRKGSKAFVEGSLRTRKWQDKTGQDRYTTEIVASEMQMLDSRGGQGQNHTDSNQTQTQTQASGSQFNDASNTTSGGSDAQPSQPATAAASTGADDFDDDIPF